MYVWVFLFFLITSKSLCKFVKVIFLLLDVFYWTYTMVFYACQQVIDWFNIFECSFYNKKCHIVAVNLWIWLGAGGLKKCGLCATAWCSWCTTCSVTCSWMCWRVSTASSRQPWTRPRTLIKWFTNTVSSSKTSPPRPSSSPLRYVSCCDWNRKLITLKPRLSDTHSSGGLVYPQW